MEERVGVVGMEGASASEPAPALVLSTRPLLAEALARCLRKGHEVPARSSGADDLATAARRFDAEPPSVVVLEAPDERSAARLISEVRERWPGRPVVLLAASDAPGWDAIVARTGALGRIRPSDDVATLAEALRAARAGQAMIRPNGRPRRPRHLPQQSAVLEQRLISQLTSRERAVLGMLCEGASSAVIAKRLDISPHTVRTHLQNLMGKLGVRSRLEAVALAQRARTAEPTRLESVTLPRPELAAGRVRVLVGIRHDLHRDGLRHALDGRDGIDATEARPADVASVVHAHPVDVVVLEAAVPDVDAPQLTAHLKRGASPPAVIVLGDGPSRELLRSSVEAGAEGFITMQATLGDLREAIARVRRGESYIPGTMLSVLLSDLIARRREADLLLARYARLSGREREVYALLVGGADQDRIAAELVISAHTARSHVQNIVKKMGARTKLEAVALANEFGFAERTTDGAVR